MAQRADEAEQMDSPSCDDEKLLRTIDQFASINRIVSRYPSILTKTLIADMEKAPGRAYHLLDMGAGGCDIPVWLLKAAARRGLDLRITACDADPRVVEHARHTHRHVERLTIRQMDVLREEIAEPVDFIFGNHFLHHLATEEIVALLRRWVPKVKQLALFSDLERHRGSYAAFSLFGLLFPNSFAREDGLLSIRKGFTSEELHRIAGEAGCGDYATVERYVPGRLVLTLAGGSKSP